MGDKTKLDKAANDLIQIGEDLEDMKSKWDSMTAAGKNYLLSVKVLKLRRIIESIESVNVRSDL